MPDGCCMGYTRKIDEIGTLFLDSYRDQIVKLHGVFSEIISDRDARFTSSFWISFQRELGKEVKFSIAYQP